MKLFLQLREDAPAELARYQLAITLPGKWLLLPAEKLLETYAAQYAKKFVEAATLAKGDWAIYVKDASPYARAPWKRVADEALMGEAFSDRQELWVAHAVQPEDLARAPRAPLCKNYGCQKTFDEATNGPVSCCHHTGAPIFHDTRKWWTCCEEHKVYDFEALLGVPGCAQGPHSLLAPAAEAKAHQAVKDQALRAAERVQQAPPPTSSLPPAPSSTTAAPGPAPIRPKAPPQLPPGMARCKHAGCQQDYLVDANGPASCRYHAAAPLFHDGTKRWPCCKQSAWEFDDFMGLAGCETGPHEPVV
ncbi:chord-domain-containing protein [Pavlovales sp. CCMP2436]|nr:chord-domain-containing protein [Pavlovales sp. CCMP2436]|mmetsp:Transcript_45063/g.111691  ORF Transcript_45063/g.111691 Transcript_45063/m.111691 type:complete len:304 (+) Transcript_45063:34-945(+)